MRTYPEQAAACAPDWKRELHPNLAHTTCPPPKYCPDK